MDPICHTLVGASLAATGLARRTRLGTATLVVAANLPDVDAVAYFFGPVAYAVRRGVTHGIVALLVLPLLLAAAMKLWSRGSRDDAAPTFGRLLMLAAIGVATHPALDWLNTYGMRWLMPLRDRWYYGDTLFIADAFVWLVLLAGLLTTRWIDPSRLRWFWRPASLALGTLLLYIAANFGLTRLAEHAALTALAGAPPTRLLASPVALHPLRREIVLDYGEEYRFGSVRFWPRPRFELADLRIARGDPSLLARAAAEPSGRWFLHWARFPYVKAESTGPVTVVEIADARYVHEATAAARGFGVIRLELR